MRMRILFSALVLGAGLMVLKSPAADPADAERVAKLIAELGSAKFEDRVKASKELEAIGPPALEALRKAAQGSNLEARRRAEELVKVLESQVQSSKLLVASRVRLRYTNTPVLKAVADLAQKTGAQIRYIDDEAKLRERTVTLDTGDTTFWQAFDQFCAKAGLVEGSPRNLSAARQPLATAVAGGAPQQIVPPATLPQPIGPNTVFPTVGPYRLITLIDGKPPAAPADYVGPFRVRAFPPEAKLYGEPPLGEKEVRFLAEVAPEPQFDFQNVLDVRIDKALDDRGQALAPWKAADGPANAAARSPRQFPIRLQAADQPSRRLRELKGTVAAQIRTPPRELAVVDNLLKAVGRTVKGEHDVTLAVSDMKKLDDGQVQLRLLVERPGDVYAHYSPPTLGNVPIPGIPGVPNQIQPVPLPNIQIKPIQIRLLPIPQPQPNPPAPGQPPATPADKAPVPPAANPPADKAPVPPAPKPAPQAVPPQAVPPQPVPANPPGGKGQAPAVPAPAQLVPAVAPVRTFGVTYLGLSVLDAKDQRLTLTDARALGSPRTVKDVVTQEVSITVKPSKDQGPPVKVVFMGNRSATVEFSFTLKDVPLP